MGNTRFSHLDSHLIVNTTTGAAVEGHGSMRSAIKALRIINEHEQRNGRPAIYTIKEV